MVGKMGSSSGSIRILEIITNNGRRGKMINQNLKVLRKHFSNKILENSLVQAITKNNA
ncbi:hypothetical protein KAT36_00775 [Candidatus Pacearchaeota archaeon]|nr:hypothetical protein [Candidatus Pacearchaeota archaeon]